MHRLDISASVRATQLNVYVYVYNPRVGLLVTGPAVLPAVFVVTCLFLTAVGSVSDVTCIFIVCVMGYVV